MKVMILAHESPGDFAQRDDQEKSATYMGEWYAYSGAMKEAGVTLKGAALEQPSMATVVSVRNGVRKVEDGPFPDTIEQLGGFFVIETPDMATAVEWASKCPSEKTGFVDVRAIPDYGQDEQERAMNYLLMLYDNEDEWAAMEDEKRNGILGSYFAYSDALREAGAYVDGNPLEHSKEGKRARQGRVEDGPFADGKEILGGYYLIEAPDLDAALDWAARCPCASFGYVEVRPVWNVGGQRVTDARAIAEETARESYGRLLAWLCARTGDVAAAEDALADAFRAALEHWPKTGVPNSPEAWIVTAARRKLIDQGRKAKTRHEAEPALALAAEEAEAKARAESPFPDERLKLMFICAHPAIDVNVRTPLMLQTVLGLDAAKIASAFLTSPKAMGARLVRAKRKIKSTAVPFIEPPLSQVPERMSAVLDAIYAAFGAGWNDVDGSGQTGELTQEAIFLAHLATSLAPDQAEAWGLLSLMLHAEARREARHSGGAYIPLSSQDTALWDRRMITAAEEALATAWRLKSIGRFQLEAAIQSAHAVSRLTGRDAQDDIILLYEKLIRIAPSLGAEIGYAAALTSAGCGSDGLTVLERIEKDRIKTYQPYWAVRAHILKIIGRGEEANACYDRAIGLSDNEAARAFLRIQKTAPV